jgi:hypothetical protein
VTQLAIEEPVNRGCRISKVTPKNGGATIDILQPPRVYEGQSKVLLDALTSLLRKAREGEVKGYALIYVMDPNPDDGQELCQVIGGAAQVHGCYRGVVLGAIEQMKQDFLRCYFADRDDAEPLYCPPDIGA